MNKAWKFLASCIAVIIVLQCEVREAHAYTYYTCNGGADLLRWPAATAMYRDRCSMPDNSNQDWAYYYGGWNWWALANVLDWNYWYNSGCSIGIDGQNETALVSRASISGYNGLTTRTNNGSCEITEADVRLANDMGYYAEDESFWNWSNAQQGRVVLVHEFGHAIGLGHAENFDAMRAATPYPVAGGNTAEPYPDDANGARFLYSGSSSVNLFASAQQLSSGSVIATGNSQTYSVHAGDPLYIKVTSVNNGSSSITSGFRLFINNSAPPGGYTGGWTLFSSTNAYNPAGSYYTQTLNVTTPSAPAGTYWIYWKVDNGNTTSEYNESDNVVHSASTLQIY